MSEMNSVPEGTPAPAVDSAPAVESTTPSGDEGLSTNWGDIVTEALASGEVDPAETPAAPQPEVDPATPAPVAEPPATPAQQPANVSPTPVAEVPPAQPQTPQQQVPAVDPNQQVQQPAPADPQQQQVQQPVPQQPQQPEGLTPEQVEAMRQQYIAQISSQYQMTPEEGQNFLTAPHEALPQLAAQLHASVLEQAVQGVMAQVGQYLPQAVAQQMDIRRQADQFESDFYGQWPELKQFENDVAQFAEIYRAQNPAATPEVFMRDLGTQVWMARQLDQATLINRLNDIALKQAPAAPAAPPQVQQPAPAVPPPVAQAPAVPAQPAPTPPQGFQPAPTAQPAAPIPVDGNQVSEWEDLVNQAAQDML